ncbi:Tc1-like transposase DDE domain-containing protein [Entamoeba marina]
MVWGAIGHGFKSQLIFFDKTVDNVKYRKMFVENGLLETFKVKYPRGFQFQQDGAPAHTCVLTMNFFKDNGIDVLPNWPANSPDLSPIENLWGIMKQEIRKKSIKNIDDLKKEIQRVWDSIKLKTINKLINSMEARLKMCVENKGNYVGSKLDFRRYKLSDEED